MGAELLAGTPLLDRVEESSGLFCVHLAASRALQHKADLYYEYMEVQRGGTPMWGSHGGGGRRRRFPTTQQPPKKQPAGFVCAGRWGEDWGGRIPWDPRPRPSVRRSSECCSCLFPGPPAPPAWLHKSLWGGHLCGVAAPALIHPPPSSPPLPPTLSVLGFPGGAQLGSTAAPFFFLPFSHFGVKSCVLAWGAAGLPRSVCAPPQPSEQRR